MIKKYQFPINLFIIFEKLNSIIYTSETLTSNHYVCVIPVSYFKSINFFLKNELTANSATLLEASAIDTKNYSEIFEEIDIIFNKNNMLLYYVYYLYLTKTRITFFFQPIERTVGTSIEPLFNTAN